MRIEPAVRLSAIALAVLAGIAAGAQTQSQGEGRRSAAASGLTAGKRTFAARCVGCHGLDGRGGQRAPNIATSTSVRRSSDAELAKVISNGRTDFGMPAFREMGRVKIQNVVDYLRLLQGKGAGITLTGDAKQGKAVFFGKAGCSSCHMVAGQEVFVGSDLSTYSRGLTPREIRESITDPPPSTGRARMAVAITRDGQRFNGMMRNEDNFSVQLQSADGAFYFLMKSDLEKLEYQALPPMPTDYGQRLSSKDLDDLVGYLQSMKSELQAEPGEEE